MFENHKKKIDLASRLTEGTGSGSSWQTPADGKHWLLAVLVLPGNFFLFCFVFHLIPQFAAHCQSASSRPSHLPMTKAEQSEAAGVTCMQEPGLQTRDLSVTWLQTISPQAFIDWRRVTSKGGQHFPENE